MLRWLEYALVGYLIAGVFGSFGKLAFLYVYLGLLWCLARMLETAAVSASTPAPPLARPDPTNTPPPRFPGWRGPLPQSR
jgi:hypothetical protein